MSTLKSSAEDLTLNADGSGNDIIFQSNAVEKGSLTAEGVLTATSFAGDGSSLTGIAGRRNIIINGAMKVAQRGTSFAAAATGTFPVDRFKFNHSSIGAYTVSQDSSAPDGFANSIKIDCTTADASPGAADHLYLATTIEGQDLQHLKKGTASAESVTLSFWVKSNKTANGQVNLRDMDNTRIIANTYTISSADTWEQKTITFAGDTTGAFGDDNGVGLNVDFWFDSGSNFSSGAMPTSWEATATADQNAGTTLALADSTSNYINITGVQLELGTVATDFDHRSYGEELMECMRYYQICQYRIGTHSTNGTDLVWNYTCVPPMRATPSRAIVGGGSYSSTTVYYETSPWAAVGTATSCALRASNFTHYGGATAMTGTFSGSPSAGDVISIFASGAPQAANYSYMELEAEL